MSSLNVSWEKNDIFTAYAKKKNKSLMERLILAPYFST
jgi:hypothetical protein